MCTPVSSNVYICTRRVNISSCVEIYRQDPSILCYLPPPTPSVLPVICRPDKTMYVITGVLAFLYFCWFVTWCLRKRRRVEVV